MSATTSKGKALITGASTGIGAIYAHRLAQRGYDPVLVARSKANLESVSGRIYAETGRRADTLVADLSDVEEVRDIVDLLKADHGITALVNNAGIAAASTLLESDPDYLVQMIDLNVSALTRLSLAAASSFVSRGAGLIINIGSVMSLAPESFNGVYSGTKAYVQNFSIALRREVEEKGVRVQLVMPGATSTAIWEKVGVPVERLPEGILMDAVDMVDASLKGLDNGEFITIPSLPEMNDFQAYEDARLALRPNLSRRVPARRYTEGA